VSFITSILGKDFTNFSFVGILCAQKGTFEISATPVGRKVIPTKVVLKIKMKSNGEIEKFKARICVLGFRQKQGLDFKM